VSILPHLCSEMADQENSVVDSSEYSDVHSGNSVCRVMQCEESDGHDEDLLCDDVKSTELTRDKLYVDLSFCDDVGQSTDLASDKLLIEQSFYDNVRQSAEPSLLEFEANRSSANVESERHDSRTSSDSHRDTSHPHWHSTPTVHCCYNPSASPAVSDGRMPTCECDSNSQPHVGTESLSVDTMAQCDEQNIINDGSNVCCQSSAVDNDAGVADYDVLLKCNKDASTTSPDCKTEDNAGDTYRNDPVTELTVSASAAAAIINLMHQCDLNHTDALNDHIK